jgi:hypothetical protein
MRISKNDSPDDDPQVRQAIIFGTPLVTTQRTIGEKVRSVSFLSDRKIEKSFGSDKKSGSNLYRKIEKIEISNRDN